jgi:hypothetical protein
MLTSNCNYCKEEKVNISKSEMKTLLRSQQGELNVVLMYKGLSNVVKDTKDAEIFRKLAAEEGHHAAVFHGLTKQNLKPKKTLSVFMPILYRIIGKKKLYPLIIKGEYDAAKNYAPIAKKFPEIESVRNDEKRHGDIVTGLL